MASSVRRLCLDAPLGRYWRIGLVVRRVWISWMNLRVSGISRVAETRETDSTAFLFIGIPTSRVLTPSCNRDCAPGLCGGANDPLQTTQLDAFDFASPCTGTLEFVEGCFITSSGESRMLNCRLSEKHLNGRAARLVNLATRHDKTTASRNRHHVHKSCTKPYAESICVK